MLDNRGIEARHFCVGPGENIPIFLEEGFICRDFLGSASSSNDDYFDDAIFNGNFDFNGGGNVGHVAFFKIIWGRDRVVEPIYMPRGNKILGFDCAHGGLDRRVKGLF